MIEKVLEAYEAKVTGRKTFMQKLAMMDTITKIVLGELLLARYFFYNSLFGSSANYTYYNEYIWCCYIYSDAVIGENASKKWETNLKGYNNDLDLLAEILKEKDFNLYEKNKIKQLIRKYYQDIETQESKRTKK